MKQKNIRKNLDEWLELTSRMEKFLPNAHLTFLIAHETCHNELTPDVSSLMGHNVE
jgi:hypothetical protein